MRKEGRVWKWRQAGKTKYRLHCSLKIPHHTAKRDVARGWCNVRSLVSTAPDILSQYYVYVRMTSMSSQQDDCVSPTSFNFIPIQSILIHFIPFLSWRLHFSSLLKSSYYSFISPSPLSLSSFLLLLFGISLHYSFHSHSTPFTFSSSTSSSTSSLPLLCLFSKHPLS